MPLNLNLTGTSDCYVIFTEVKYRRSFPGGGGADVSWGRPPWLKVLLRPRPHRLHLLAPITAHLTSLTHFTPVPSKFRFASCTRDNRASPLQVMTLKKKKLWTSWKSRRLSSPTNHNAAIHVRAHRRAGAKVSVALQVLPSELSSVSCPPCPVLGMSLPSVSRLLRSALRTHLVPAANVTSKPAKHNVTTGVSSSSSSVQLSDGTDDWTR